MRKIIAIKNIFIIIQRKKITSTKTATSNQEDIDISGAYDCTIGDIAIKAQLLITARRLRTSNANCIENKKYKMV